MRFMVIVKSSAESEAGQLPTEQELRAMGAFNEELAKAGIMLAGEGLQASSKGARMTLRRQEQADRDRRSVRGDERADRRLLDPAGALEGGSDRVDEARAVPRTARSRSGRCSRTTTSAPSSRPSCASRKRASGSSRRRTTADLREPKVAVSSATSPTIDAVWRIESAKLIARLTRIVGDVGLAEDLAQDALVAALEQWPESGVPDNPGAWLMATAKRRAIDRLRRGDMLDRKHAEIARELEEQQEAAAASRTRRSTTRRRRPAAPRLHRVSSGALDGGARRADAAPARRTHDRRDRARVPRARTDDRRSASCARSARSPKRACRSRCRARDELAARLASVLEVIYLVFNEGYSATAGDDWMRPALCEDALRLGRVLAELDAGRSRSARAGRADGDPGVAAARARRTRPASRCCCSIRTAAAGIDCSSAAASPRSSARTAPRLGGAARAVRAAGGDRRVSRARAAPATRPTGRASPRCTTRSPSVSPVAGRRAEPGGRGRHGLRARRGARARRPPLRTSRRSRGYHLLPSVRGDLLAKLGRDDEARAEFERAASLTRNARERELLTARAAWAAGSAGRRIDG